MRLDRPTRRTFLKAIGIGALSGLAWNRVTAQAVFSGLPTRMLGRTGERLSVPGLGLAPLGIRDAETSEFEGMVHAALDAGVRLLDTAPNYGNAEEQLRPILKARREDVFLVTKVEDPTRVGALRQIETSLRRTGIDRLDAVLIHNAGGLDADYVTGPRGALAGLREAKRRGWTRFIGIAAHTRPARCLPYLDTGEIDLVAAAMNFVDRHTYNFEGIVLPAARRRGIGVLAMQVLGGATRMRYDQPMPALLSGPYYAPAVRYALSLEGVDNLLIGIGSLRELAVAVETIRRARPLMPRERYSLAVEGRRLARRWGPHLGPIA